MASQALLQVCGAGDASRAAATVLDEEAGAISRAVRRALPFVAKRGLPVTTSPFSVGTASETLAALAPPTYVLVLKCASGARALLAFDGRALGLMLDGVLGGDGRAVPELRADGLTPPQGALAARMADAVGAAVAERLNTRFGLALRPDPGDHSGGVASAAFLIAHVEIGGETKGTMVLALPRTLSVTRRTEFRSNDPAVAAVLSKVDIEMSVELGTMTVSLARIASLKPGDTLLSDIATSNDVVVRADGISLFEGRPTNVGGRFAVRIERKGSRP